MASNELISHTLKYQHAIPLYRQEKYFDMMGATLSRQTLCNWTMSAADALAPIHKHMKKELLNRCHDIIKNSLRNLSCNYSRFAIFFFA